MLLDVQSYALDYKEHAFGPYRAMLPMVRSSGPVADDEDWNFRRRCLVIDEKTLPVVPSSWEEGYGVVEINNDITYYKLNI